MAERHRGTAALQRLVEYAPSTGGLALWLRHHDRSAGVRLPVISTDGEAVFYGSAFEELSLPRQAALVAHEVLHVAFRHAQRLIELEALLGDLDRRLFNTCADAIVNSSLAHLRWLELSPAAVRLERLLHEALGVKMDAEHALLEWDVERLYRAVDDRRPDRRGGRGRGDRRGNKGGDGRAGPDGKTDPRPSTRPGARAERVRALGATEAPDLLPGDQSRGAPEQEAEKAREWRERLLRGHAGDGEFSMLRTVGADLPRSHVPWEQVLRMQLGRCLLPRPSPSWSRPSRSYLANRAVAARRGQRLPWEPGISGARAVPRLAVIVDTSGSVDPRLLDRFAAEVAAIARRTEAGLVLVLGDDRVRRVERLEPVALGRGAALVEELLAHGASPGGGGTDFTPLLEEADRHRPDVGVVFTDLEGPARHRPAWPLLWAVPEEQRHARPPFGRLLVLR